MKILWIVNTMFPDLCEKKNLAKTVIGGWMYETAKTLVSYDGVELIVVTTHNDSVVEKFHINNILYYLIPYRDNAQYDDSLKVHWGEIFEKEKPDIVHIHGTEYTHGLVALHFFQNLPFVVSIQGMVGVYSRYYLGGLSLNDVLMNISFRDLIKGTLLSEQKKFKKSGKFEEDYLKKSKYVIGRTDWDKAHVKTINSKINYFFCNESLREEFYSADKWNIREIKPHTIFLSQAGYPIKGLHKVLEAVCLLKDKFPDIQIRIGGIDILKNNENFIEKIKISGYGNYIKKIIDKYGLSKNVKFLGLLDAYEMVQEYRKANVFICPSSIENSPNSVGEAQLLGTPVIASYVGGIPNMITHRRNGIMYRFEEVEMLAMHIEEIFSNEELCLNLSENGKISASVRHDLGKNTSRLYGIYKDIIYKKNEQWK